MKEPSDNQDASADRATRQDGWYWGKLLPGSDWGPIEIRQGKFHTGVLKWNFNPAEVGSRIPLPDETPAPVNRPEGWPLVTTCPVTSPLTPEEIDAGSDSVVSAYLQWSKDRECAANYILALEQRNVVAQEHIDREHNSALALLCGDHAQVWYTERNHIKVPECGCIACSVVQEDQALRAKVKELEQRNAALTSDLVIMEACARSYDHKQPFCEHENRYAFTDDGGKTGYCVMCRNAALEADRDKVAAFNLLLTAVNPTARALAERYLEGAKDLDAFVEFLRTHPLDSLDAARKPEAQPGEKESK